MAYKDCHNGVYIRYRTSGKLFSIRRLSANTKVSMNLIRDLLYADDCDLVAHTQADMQQLLTDDQSKEDGCYVSTITSCAVSRTIHLCVWP